MSGPEGEDNEVSPTPSVAWTHLVLSINTITSLWWTVHRSPTTASMERGKI
jgi:hypothetical protein